MLRAGRREVAVADQTRNHLKEESARKNEALEDGDVPQSPSSSFTSIKSPPQSSVSSSSISKPPGTESEADLETGRPPSEDDRCGGRAASCACRPP